MPDLYLIIDLIVVVALSALAIAVLSKNNAIELNRIFALFVACINIWIIANYISNDLHNSPSIAVKANYLVFFFSYLASIFLLQFVVKLADDVSARRLLKRAYIPLLLVGLAGASPLVVEGVAHQGQVYAVTFGELAPVYFVTLILNLMAAMIVIGRAIPHSKGNQHGRLVVLFRSLCWTFPVLILAQVILPATTGWFGLTNVGILPMVILVFGLYYSVVRHRLFDLRPLIVRTAVYSASLGIIIASYALVTHYLTVFVTKNGNSMVAGVVNVSLIAVMVLAFAPLKEEFKRITNRFFYQDAYDPQELLDSLNRALVSSLELKYLMDATNAIITERLKLSYCKVSIQESGRGHRLFGPENGPNEAAVLAIRRLSAKVKEEILLTDYLDQEHHSELQAILQRHGIAALVKLHSKTQATVEDMGYIILGLKRSGSPYTRQDMRALDTIANELIIAIQNALRFEEIERFNTTLQDKIDDATRKLRRANDKLSRLNETKDDFISMASHQLRTPLTSVKGYVSMVLDGDAGKISRLQRRLLNQSFVSSQRMVYLISDLLNVSRIKTGKFIIEPIQCNLAKVVQEEVEQLAETAKSRHLTLEYYKPEHFPTFMLDETKLRQVIMNFLDNAVYYTPAEGSIEVHLVDKPQTIEFTVTDDGIGVPRYEQHHLFTKFFRAPNAKRARPDGTGLGLFMAKKVIIAQGGAVIFKSHEGKGSTFGFTFAKSRIAVALQGREESK